jgi:hypothetical protein
MDTPRQLSFQFGRPPVAAPAKPASPPPTIDGCRRILRQATIMAMDPRYDPRQQALLENLANHMRWRIRGMQGR